MTFKDDFPNIVLKEQNPLEIKDLRYTAWTMEELLKDIQLHCLDKTKVMEAIAKAPSKIRNKLLEELRLIPVKHEGGYK